MGSDIKAGPFIDVALQFTRLAPSPNFSDSNDCWELIINHKYTPSDNCMEMWRGIDACPGSALVAY